MVWMSPAEAQKKYGIESKCQIMENGQGRFHLIGPDGSKYVRTHGAGTGAWQKSHSHEGVIETYIVQTGWMGYALLEGNEAKIRILKPNEIVTTQRGRDHNVYLPKGSMIHTVKHGNVAEGDWKGSPELDGLLRHLANDESVLAAARSASASPERAT